MDLNDNMSEVDWRAREEREAYEELPHFYLVTEIKRKGKNSTNQHKKLRAKCNQYFDCESCIGKKLDWTGSEDDFSKNLQAELDEAWKKIRKLEKNCKLKQKRIKKLNLLRENQKSMLEQQEANQQLLDEMLAAKDKFIELRDKKVSILTDELVEKDKSIELLEKNGIKMMEMMEKMMYHFAQQQSTCPVEEPSSVHSILDQIVDEEIASIAEFSWQSTQQQNDNGIVSVNHPVDDDNEVTADASLLLPLRQTDEEIYMADQNLDDDIALPTEELQPLVIQQVANNLSVVCYNLHDKVDLTTDDEFALRAEDSPQSCQQKLDEELHIADDATELPSSAVDPNCSVKIEMMNVHTNAAYMAPKPTERVKKKSLSSDECLDRVAFETEMPT